MRSVDRIVRRIIVLCAILLLAPQFVMLANHIVGEVLSRPASSLPAGPASGGAGFESGVFTTLIILVLCAGLLSRLGTFLRLRDPHRETRDRRARTMPRHRAEGVPPHGGDRVVVDDDPFLP